MVFLRAFGLTRFAESQQTGRPGVPYVRRQASTRFPQVKVRVSGVRGNCHCPAWRLLYWRMRRIWHMQCTSVTGVSIHASVRADEPERRERTRPRVDARIAATRTHTSAASTLRQSRCTEKRTAARTVCLLAGRRLGEESADVLPVRQRNFSKVDYCRCPRHSPHL